MNSPFLYSNNKSNQINTETLHSCDKNNLNHTNDVLEDNVSTISEACRENGNLSQLVEIGSLKTSSKMKDFEKSIKNK